MDAEYNIEHFFMQAALAEARAAADEGEIPIGAVVVCGGRIVGKGHNRVEALGDATAHAEMQALVEPDWPSGLWRSRPQKGLFDLFRPRFASQNRGRKGTYGAGVSRGCGTIFQKTATLNL